MNLSEVRLRIGEYNSVRIARLGWSLLIMFSIWADKLITVYLVTPSGEQVERQIVNDETSRFFVV